jgi:hypothetical protein
MTICTSRKRGVGNKPARQNDQEKIRRGKEGGFEGGSEGGREGGRRE